MSGATRALEKAIGYEDIRALARRRLPRVVFDSVDGGAGAELTLAANRRAFDEVMLRPRQAAAPDSVDLATTVLGERLKLPILLGPCGSARVIHPHGERAIARAAARAGTVYVLPHLGGTTCEEVRRESAGGLWYQIYLYGGREVAEPALQRAWAAGYRVLVVTLDNGRTVRERDVRNGFGPLLSGDPLRALPHAWQVLARPRWLAGYLRDGAGTATPNARLPDGRAMRLADLAAAATRPHAHFHWADFDWLRNVWPGPIVAKGILSADDARRAVDCGVQGLVVSNHGGRTMDGLEASLRVLPEVVAAVGGRAEVLLDSGVRCGLDVVKALCLGARAVLIGRPYMLALAHGEAGVNRMLALLEADLRENLATLGCASPAELGPDFAPLPSHWSRTASAARA